MVWTRRGRRLFGIGACVLLIALAIPTAFDWSRGYRALFHQLLIAVLLQFVAWHVVMLRRESREPTRDG